MSILRKTVLTCAMFSVVSACADPVVAPPLNANNEQMSCAAINQDIQDTGVLKREARAEDKFQWKYIFVLNGFVSAYRINKAETAAQERLEGLRMLGQRKGCFGDENRVIAPVTPAPVVPLKPAQ